MPVYDYRCSQCQEVFEVRRSMAETEKPAVCPTCQCEQTTRIYSIPNVVGGARLQASGCAGCSSAQPSACSACRSAR